MWRKTRWTGTPALSLPNRRLPATLRTDPHNDARARAHFPVFSVPLCASPRHPRQPGGQTAPTSQPIRQGIIRIILGGLGGLGFGGYTGRSCRCRGGVGFIAGNRPRQITPRTIVTELPLDLFRPLLVGVRKERTAFRSLWIFHDVPLQGVGSGVGGVVSGVVVRYHCSRAGHETLQ